VRNLQERMVVSEKLSYGVDPTGAPVEVPTGNIIVTGSPGSGATMTMRSLAYDAMDKGWDVAVATPKYTHPYGEFPDLAGHADREFHSDPNDTPGNFRAEAERLAEWIETVPVGTAGHPRLVVLDSFQSVVGGDADLMDRCLRAMVRLLGDRHTTVSMRMQVLISREVPDRLARSIDAVIAMGQHSAHDAAHVFPLVGRYANAPDMALLTNHGQARGYGVLVTPEAAVPTHTPLIESSR